MIQKETSEVSSNVCLVGIVVKINLSSKLSGRNWLNSGAVKFTQEKGKRSLETESKNPDDRNETTWNGRSIWPEIRGFYNYYGFANNSSEACAGFGYIMSYSLYKTLAQKLNSTVQGILAKYKKTRCSRCLIKTRKGKTELVHYQRRFQKTKTVRIRFLWPSPMHNVSSKSARTCGYA